MGKILVVEDDISLLRGIEYALSADKHIISTAKTMTEALQKIKTESYDLITLDINLPDGDGFSLCQKLKAQKDIPIVFLTAKDLDTDQETGFNLGADDYITKPFNMNIFRKRIQAVLRRYKSHDNLMIYEDENLKINFTKAECLLNNKPLEITPTEYKLLQLFTTHSKQVLTKQMILEQIWDKEGSFVDEHVITVNINRLRNKLEIGNKKYIKTVYGMGYMWIGGESE